MDNVIMNYFWYWFIPAILCVICCILWNEIFSDKRKPIYRIDANGYVQFYYRKFSCWEYFPIWNDNDDHRVVEVCDTIRNLNYDLSYFGPGRVRLKLKFDDDAFPVTQEFITDHVRKLYPEYKNSEQLWQLHKLYVDKENIVLQRILKNKIIS